MALNTSSKVEHLISTIVNDYKRKLDELLSFCESPIEKLMLLHFFNYANSFKDKFGNRFFSDIVFVEDCIFLHDPETDPIERKMLADRVKKYSYRYNSLRQDYEKVTGFKMRHSFSEGIAGSLFKQGGTEVKLVSKEFEVYPQQLVHEDDKSFRLDIALLMNRIQFHDFADFYNHQNGKVIETRKVAIECDGYEFHSTPEQITNDNIRTRKLERIGWKVLRYSGKELYRLETMDNFHSLFEEIIDILSK